ncbi:hypothetical protein BDV59DRAFT_151587 [Aspergillus ambiguus]|uniref:uncharacterized protein n=1 Tax=Aspergillus ambiguus TaxID=176160 RepID=UPI003CCE1A85
MHAACGSSKLRPLTPIAMHGPSSTLAWPRQRAPKTQFQRPTTRLSVRKIHRGCPCHWASVLHCCRRCQPNAWDGWIMICGWIGAVSCLHR